MSAAAVPSHAFLNLTLGALLLGAFATAILFGIFCQQCFTFFRKFTEEGRALKYSVYVIWVSSAANVALGIHTIYTVLVTQIGMPTIHIPRTLAGGVITTVIGDVIVRSWFMYRIWILSEKRWILLILPALLNITILGLALSLSVHLIELDSTIYPASLDHLMVADISLIITTDFCLAAIICYFLHRRRVRLNKHTRSLVNTLMAYTINTGLVTSVAWLVCLITHVTLPGTLIMNAVFLPLGNLYNICLLASLNARDWFRQEARRLPVIEMSSMKCRSAATASDLQKQTSDENVGASTIRLTCTMPSSTAGERIVRASEASESSENMC